MSLSPAVYLASNSPRRRQLLEQIGVSHELLSVEVEETPRLGESPEALVRRLALAKARAGWVCRDRILNLPVIGADTTVVLDQVVMGKPRDQQDALWMLGALSGRQHEVLSAVSVVFGNQTATRLSRTRVNFRDTTPGERLDYWNSGESAGKAGAYAIQGAGAVFVEALCGSYSGVVGMPLFETSLLLAEFGIQVLGKHDSEPSVGPQG
jgi:septum formation protein